MYIPRPAKLLFTIDDGWNKFLENTAIALVRGRVYLWSACLPAALAMGVRRYCCASSDCSHSRFSAKAVSQKEATAVVKQRPRPRQRSTNHPQ
ncbi:hypothetical protein QE193_22825 (plasmid) [Arsenophonus nasoniae]|nr:hypothetical protein [Arsenophonus nasoniae]WGM18059.1 hypothetical protein QE193_22825 [Arsenophonus nasoniae]